MKTTRIAARVAAMLKPRRRFSFLTVIAAAAGGLGAAVMMSTTTAPAAHADAYSDLIVAIDGDYANGQAAFTTALTDFSSSNFGPGLAALFDGVNDDALSAPQNLLIGTVDSLTNAVVTSSIPWNLPMPTDFSDAVNIAGLISNGGALDFTNASDFFALGQYGDALYLDLLGADLSTVVPLEELLLGAAVSF
jgi:hypothetical protein